MRSRALQMSLLLLLSACGGAATATSTTTGTATVAGERAEVQVAAAAGPREPADVQERPEWEGFAATASQQQTLTAMTHGPIDVFESPESTEPKMTLEGTTIIGSVTVLAVVDGPEDGWLEVMLPVRPNGSTGWVRAGEVSLYVSDSEIRIDLSERELTYLVDGVEVLTTEAGIGSDHNETPIGQYFVTDSVTLSDPNSPWGPHALGISARSETITEFNGGDGIIGIHGTNNPGSIGGNISLGCVRLPNDQITALYEMVPLGTRVTVSA